MQAFGLDRTTGTSPVGADLDGLNFLQAENIATLLKAANVSVDAYWPGLFAKALEKTSIDDLMSNVGAGGGGAPAAGGGSGGGGEAAAEEKKEDEAKEEEEEEEDEDMGFSLFD